MPDERHRLVVEQAKGVVAERFGLDLPAAFAWLCEHARSQNLDLTEAAQDIVDSIASRGGGSSQPEA